VTPFSLPPPCLPQAARPIWWWALDTRATLKEAGSWPRWVRLLSWPMTAGTIWISWTRLVRVLVRRRNVEASIHIPAAIAHAWDRPDACPICRPAAGYDDAIC
jgi:hypothetical protein